MDFYTALLLAAALAATVACYAIYSTSAGAADERKKKHEEFNSALEPHHRETIAKIGAERDAKIAEYTRKPPAQTLDGEAKRIGNGDC